MKSRQTNLKNQQESMFSSRQQETMVAIFLLLRTLIAQDFMESDTCP